jgi:hypothetical protein
MRPQQSRMRYERQHRAAQSHRGNHSSPELLRPKCRNRRSDCPRGQITLLSSLPLWFSNGGTVVRSRRCAGTHSKTKCKQPKHGCASLPFEGQLAMIVHVTKSHIKNELNGRITKTRFVNLVFDVWPDRAAPSGYHNPNRFGSPRHCNISS